MHQGNKISLNEKISKYVMDLYKEKLPGWAVYHDLSHTIETVEACEEIGKGSGLSDEEFEILFIAAWFHDTGYIYQVEGHEEKSAEIALNFLKTYDYPDDKTNKVIDCIMATKISNKPNNLIESVICDSDLISLGRHDYLHKNDLLKSEMERRENKNISELAWLQRSLDFLSSRKFYTEYAQQYFGSQLEENIKNLRKKIEAYL